MPVALTESNANDKRKIEKEILVLTGCDTDVAKYIFHITGYHDLNLTGFANIPISFVYRHLIH